MTETLLTQADRKRIRDDIKLTSIIALIFSIALVVLVLIVPLVFYFFGKTVDGFARRSLFIIGGLSIPFIAVSWKNILRFIDLWIGKKINFKTTDYEIEKTKDGAILTTKSPVETKFDLYDDIPTLIKLRDPVIIGMTKLSKTLLFISQDNNNLLEKGEKENK